MIGNKTSIGDRPHLVLLQNPGPVIPDGDGDFTQTWTDLAPRSLYVSIEPATSKDLERVAAGTVMSTATQILKGPYHPQITTKTRVLFGARQFSVTGVASPEERHVETICTCVEIVQ